MFGKANMSYATATSTQPKTGSRSEDGHCDRSETPSVSSKQQPEEDSLKKRYAYKLLANLVVFSISIATAGIIPRGLGPKAYGEFSFLSDFFTRVIGFLNAGTALGFFAKISQRREEHALIRFYWGFVVVAGLGLAVFVACAFLLGGEDILWPAQQLKYIWLAVFWGLLTWVSDNISKIVDAYALTAKGEIIKVSQKILGTGTLLLMLWLDRFSLTEFFCYQYLITLYLCAAWARVLRHSGIPLWPREKLGRRRTIGYAREFYTYSAPLLSYSLVGLLTGVLDRWILQTFSGSVEQGYFGLSVNIGTICFLFTSAMTPLLLREFSVAFGAGKTARMRQLFSRYLPMLYSVTACIAVFISLQAQKVCLLLGGEKYQAAGMAVSVMALYPIHQTYGQLTGSVYYATGQTRIYRNIGITFMLIGLPLVFWLTAPARMHGMNLGSAGVAMKIVVMQLAVTNMLLWFNCRYLKLRYARFVSHQLYSIAIFAACAFVAMKASDTVLHSILPAFLLSGVVYVALTTIAIFCVPSLFATTRSEIFEYYRRFSLWTRQIFK